MLIRSVASKTNKNGKPLAKGSIGGWSPVQNDWSKPPFLRSLMNSNGSETHHLKTSPH